MRISAAAGRQAGPIVRGRGRRGGLAALPDPVKQEQLAVEGDRRARELLAAARAGGDPVVGRNGNARSHVTLPEYRRGRAPRNKGRRFPVEVLTPEEVLALVDAQVRSGPTAFRNRALIVLLWRSGLRVAEALALMPEDIAVSDHGVVITVLQGKGAKRRVAVMERDAWRYIEAWLEARSKLIGLPPGAPLFCTTRGAAKGLPVNDSSVREMLKHAARKAGIAKRVHPHGLRHTHAYELSMEDIPVRLIQMQLGHQDLAMTAHYIDHLNPKHLIERMGARQFPGQPAAAEPLTAVAMSAGAPVQASPRPSARARMDPPEPRPAPSRGRHAKAGEGAQRVLDVIVANGGSATQAQLRRALNLSIPQVLRLLHKLHEQDEIVRAGFDRNRSIIWKVAPPPVIVNRVIEYRQAPRGEGPRRVFDALESLDGRASQAQLARTLGVEIGTIHSHCLSLHRDGLIERAGLDKTNSNRGSQVWCVKRPRARFDHAGGYSRQLTYPRS